MSGPDGLWAGIAAQNWDEKKQNLKQAVGCKRFVASYWYTQTVHFSKIISKMSTSAITFCLDDDRNRSRLPSFLAKHDWAKHQWPHCVFFPGANPSAWTTMMKEWVWLCPHFNFMLVDKPKVEQTGKLLASLGDSEVQSELSTGQIVGLVFGVLAVAMVSGLAVGDIRKRRNPVVPVLIPDEEQG